MPNCLVMFDREFRSFATRYSDLSLYVYVFLVLLSAGLVARGGWICGGEEQRWRGIVLAASGLALYLFDNWFVLFVWLR